MPFDTPGNYLNCIDEFIPNWTGANTALGLPANAIVLRGGYAVANLVADRAALAALYPPVQNNLNARQIAAQDRDLRRAAARERLRQFRSAVQGLLSNTLYSAALPKMPQVSAASGPTLAAFDDMASLWSRINTDAPPPAGFTQPLTLAGGYTLAAFTADLNALKAAYAALQTAGQNLRLAIRAREDLAATIRTRLKEYRKAVAARFPAGHAILVALPDLTAPGAPGLTSVPLTVIWDAVENKALLRWTATTYATAAYYELRYHPGPAYRADEEQFVARISLGTTEFLTLVGLPASGSLAYFKLYVVTQRGAEAGSKAVKALRP